MADKWSHRFVVKPNNLGKWTIYDRKKQMKYAGARTKSKALDKARGRATTLLRNTDIRGGIGIEKRTKTGKKGYEVVEL